MAKDRIAAGFPVGRKCDGFLETGYTALLTNSMKP